MFNKFKDIFNILKEDIIKPDIAHFYVEKENIKPIMKYLKEESSLLFERLDCIKGEEGQITYILNSDKYNTKCAISCYVESEIESVCDIFKSANFDEREIYDLLGIRFINHPNLKRILLPDSFIGHPLKKDYKMEDERLKWNYEWKNAN